MIKSIINRALETEGIFVDDDFLGRLSEEITREVISFGQSVQTSGKTTLLMTDDRFPRFFCVSIFISSSSDELTVFAVEIQEFDDVD